MGDDLGVLPEDRGEGGGLQRRGVVELVRDEGLGVLLLAGVGQPDVALHPGHGRQAGLGRPPVVAAVDDLLLGRGEGHAPGAGGDRPVPGGIVVLEGRPVLSLEDVLRDDVDPDVVLVGHEVEEARRRDLELDDHRVGVRGGRLLDELLHVDAPADLGTQVAQTIEREGDVFRAEGLAVANSEVRHHLWIAPDLRSGLERERLVDRKVVDERGRIHVG